MLVVPASRSIFAPDPNLSTRKVINSLATMPHVFDPEFDVDMTRVQPLREHWLQNWCKGDQVAFRWVRLPEFFLRKCTHLKTA